MRWPWRGSDDRELDEEFSTHIEMAAEDYHRQGLPRAEARRRALIDFGGMQQAKEARREAHRLASFEMLWQDVRYAFRSLRRDAAFAAMAIVILTLGIGANTAVFSIVNSVLLRPLAYAHAPSLIRIEEVIPQLAHIVPVLPVNGRHFLDWQENARTLEDVAMLAGSDLNLAATGDPERVSGSRSTTNLFDVLGVTAQLGRTFVAADAPEKVVVISDGLWQRRFGGVHDIVGRTVSLDGVAHKVIGVLPAHFRDPFARKIDVYTPWDVRGNEWGWAGDHNYFSVARLRKGVSAAQAVAELNVLQARIAARLESIEKVDLFIRVTPLREQLVGRSRLALLTLMGAVAVVLLIACLNLGNLMLARSIARIREVAVRRALGASMGRIMRGITFEGLLISAGGALLGLLLAQALLKVFQGSAPAGLPRADEVSLDPSAVLFALALAVLTALIFALLPAWQMRRIDPQDALRSGGRSMTDARGRLRFRQVLTGAEVGLSVALLILAGLLTRSAMRLNAVDRGFSGANVLTAELSLPDTQYQDPEARRRFFDSVLAAVRAEPGMMAAGAISKLPFRGERWMDTVTAEGDNRPIAERPMMAYRPATPDYFRAMGIPVLAGRTMLASDYPRLATVVSARTAERVWPGENAVGKRFRRSNPGGPAFEVVGVVGDVRTTGLDQSPEPIVYVPFWARVPTTASLAIRTAGDPSAAIPRLRRAVWSVDSQIPLADVMTMSVIEQRTTAYRTFLRNLVIAFACSALLIAALGTYSVLSWSTGRRKAEIGLRMALGAGAAQVLGMILRQGLWPVVYGVAAGAVVSLAAGRVLSTLLFQVSLHDPVTYALVITITLATALVACWIPAYRASRVPPVDALRYE